MEHHFDCHASYNAAVDVILVNNVWNKLAMCDMSEQLSL